MEFALFQDVKTGMVSAVARRAPCNIHINGHEVVVAFSSFMVMVDGAVMVAIVDGR